MGYSSRQLSGAAKAEAQSATATAQRAGSMSGRLPEVGKEVRCRAEVGLQSPRCFSEVGAHETLPKHALTMILP
jgi:hypothetical protein